MKILSVLKSLLSQPKNKDATHTNKDLRGLRDIFESQIPSPKIQNEFALFRIQIPDTLAEPLTAEHIKKIGDIPGLTTEEAIFALDMSSVCHTGNPLFSLNGMAINYIFSPDSSGLNMSIDGDYSSTTQQSPSEHFYTLLNRLKKSLDASKPWGAEKTKATLAEFLPKQGAVTALKVGTDYRQSRRKQINDHIENKVHATSLLDNPDLLLGECLFPSGFVYQSANGLDEILIGYAIENFYKSPISAGYSGLNACIAATDVISAIHSNRCLYSFSNTYEVGQGAIWISSKLSKVLYATPPEKNTVSGDGSKRIISLVENSKQGAAIYAKLPPHRYKFDLIEQWAAFSKEIAIKKQAQRFISLLSNDNTVICPLTAVENKRLDLHKAWLESRADHAQ